MIEEAVLEVQPANDVHGGTVPKTIPSRFLTTNALGNVEWTTGFPPALALPYINLGAGPFPGEGLLRVNAEVGGIIVGLGDNTPNRVLLFYWDGHDIVYGDSMTDGVTAQLFHVKPGGFYIFHQGGVPILGWDITGLDLFSHEIRNVTTLNGATVFAPTQAVLTNADLTRHISDGSQLVLPANTLSANRALTLGTSGTPVAGDTITVVRFDTNAFTYAVINGGGGGGTLYTFAASAAGKRATSFRYDGTNWAWLGSVMRIQ